MVFFDKLSDMRYITASLSSDHVYMFYFNSLEYI